MEFPFKLLLANDFDVVGFGTNALDYLMRVPEYPAFNSKVEISEYTVAAGGEIASNMVGLTRLGLKCAYAGRFGGDQAGHLGMLSLVDAGVDVTYAETIHAAQTQVAFIVIDERNGERTILWQRDARLAFTASEAPVEAAIRGKVLHMTPHDTEACIRMSKEAKANDVIVSADVDNVFDGIEELLPLVDVCIASAEFPERLLGIKDKKAVLSEIASRFGCAVTGLTLGAAGSLIYCQDTFFETPAFNVPGGCVDTTGAGDAFRTGFLYGMLTGASVEESARTANAVAALKCRGLGARLALPDKQDLTTLLKTHNPRVSG